jgi:hypothetical protein
VVNPDGTEIPPDPAHMRWLDQAGTIELLTYKLGPHDSARDEVRYSLGRFKVANLFTVLPRAPRPPSDPPTNPTPQRHETSALEALLLELASRYEQTRTSMPAGNERTHVMTDIFEKATETASDSSPAQISLCLDSMLARQSDGSRLKAYGFGFGFCGAQSHQHYIPATDARRLSCVV